MKTKLFLLMAILGFISTCQQTNVLYAQEIKKGMIKVTIFYPNGEGKTFDMNYYVTKHMPLVAQLLGDSLKSLSIDKGISGRTPDAPVPYLAIGHLYFESVSAYQNSMKLNGEKIRGDVPNYTNIQPVIQISEVLE
ncbi:MAG TPA: EthD family reductase [Ohtaekwangia sp.]